MFRPTLALGADSNSAPCWAINEQYKISEALGDLSILENLEKFKSIVSNYPPPEIIACDLHPGFASVEFGETLAKDTRAELVRVQHHKAHAAGCAFEHKLKDYVAIVCDGLGYGDDGKLWGGEVFLVNGKNFKRVGHLEEQKQLGGDSATYFPMKMLFGIMSKFLDVKELSKLYPEDEIQLHSKQIEVGYNIFTTTSTGRVLDAVSALLGVCRRRDYEGQPAIELEQFASEPYDLESSISDNVLNTTYLFKYLHKNLDKNKSKLAATAQMYIARGLHKIAKQYKLPIVFTGGVAYNKMISGYMKDNGVLLNKKIPPGDAGISIGQAVIANH